jgi:hypothetical protein
MKETATRIAGAFPERDKPSIASSIANWLTTALATSRSGGPPSGSGEIAKRGRYGSFAAGKRSFARDNGEMLKPWMTGEPGVYRTINATCSGAEA